MPVLRQINVQRSFFMRRDIWRHSNTATENPAADGTIGRAEIADQSPFKTALVQVGKIIAVFQRDCSVKVRRQRRVGLDVNRRPNFFDGEKAALALVKGAENPVRSVVAVRVDDAVFVRAHHTLVGIYPQKHAAGEGLTPHQFPVVIQTGAETAVIQAVQSFRGHENIAAFHLILYACVALIMIGIDATVQFPRVQHAPVLRIINGKIIIEVGVPAAFIAVIPEKNTRMIDIPSHQFADKLFTDLGVIRRLLPAR